MIINPNELSACKFSNWYDKFHKITIESKFLQIPNDLFKYLKEEIIILPKECNKNINNFDGFSDDDDDEEDDDSIKPPEFPEFSKQVDEILNDFNRAAFIKTNWHCPKDAYWITAGQTLKVKDLTDFYQLLKASSICKDDLNNELIEENIIVLRKWVDIDPKNEFRCFVKDKCLIAISPRDWPQYNEYMNSQRNDIISDIVTIFKEKIKDSFPLNNYCFDVYRDRKDSISLIDFSPFNKNYTESLAFHWDELENEFFNDDRLDEPEFRYINSEIGIQPNRRNNFGIPKDIIDMFEQQSATNSSTTPQTSRQQDTTSLNELFAKFYSDNSN